MKIGILTFHYALNYGAVLQCYALCKAIQKLGHEVEVIDYRPDDVLKRHRGLGIRTLLIKKPRFNSFIRKHIPLSPKTYKSAESLKCNLPLYDCYITGSDQVWNPEVHHYFDPTYFLKFVPKPGGRLISYAASFGNDYIPEAYKSQITDLINNFDSISVREESAIQLLAGITDKKATCVLDPTLLNVDFSKVTKPPTTTKPYIAVYCLEKTDGFINFVAKVKQLTSLPTVSLGDSIRGIDLSAKHIGPAEWLGYLKNASYVCTNSFHGVALSIKFRKHFLVHPTSNRFVRITDLLDSLGLTDNIIFDPAQLDTKCMSQDNINYDDVYSRLNGKIVSSLNYLNASLLN